jgi:hypothetical protein
MRKCVVCGDLFRPFQTPSRWGRKTCSLKCANKLRSQAGGASDEIHELQKDPIEYRRRREIVRHNSLVQSGQLEGQVIEMDWL